MIYSLKINFFQLFLEDHKEQNSESKDFLLRFWCLQHIKQVLDVSLKTVLCRKLEGELETQNFENLQVFPFLLNYLNFYQFYL